MDKEAKIKSWEKPWTTDEIRDQSSKWNLAGDAGLLKALEEFAENLNTRSNSTLGKLNTLVNDLEQTSSDISNVTNTFLLLSNKQFFENRVKDDDESTSVQKPDDKATVDEEAKAEPSDPKERIREAFVTGMGFLDTMFSSVELVVGSDSEEEEDSLTSAGHLLKPINPYTSRPLPCIIGSREFYEDDHVGLGAHSDEDESAEQDGDTSVQSSDSDSEAENEVRSSDLLKRKKISTPSESENSQPESEQSGVPEKKKHHSSDQMFGQESPPEAEVSAPVHTTAQKSFAAELAAKLGGMAAADVNTQNSKPAVANAKPAMAKDKSDIYAQTRKHFDDLFAPPSDEEDDSLFGSGGKYSGGRGLFDDAEDWKKPSKKLWEEPSKSNAEAVGVEESKSKDVPPNIPAIVVPNLNNLFDAEDVDEGIFSFKPPKLSDHTRTLNEVETNNINQSLEVKTSTPNQKGDSLFGFIDDLQNTSAINAVPRPVSDQSSLFENTAEGVRTKDSGLPSDLTGQSAFKKPAGGVSIFGNMAVNASMLASKLPSSSKEFASNVATVGGSSTSGVEANTVSRSYKSNSGNSSAGPQARQSLPQATTTDNEDDADKLFKKETNTQSSQSNSLGKVSTSVAKQSLSLFDDLDSEDDDLLFSSTGSTGSRSRQSVDILDKKSQFPVMPKKNIFDDEDLFGVEVGSGSDFDIFGAKKEAEKYQTGVETLPKQSESVLKNESLAGPLENGSNPTVSTSENINEKNKKDSKLEDISWLDDADTGDIFSGLNNKLEQSTCKEPILHTNLISDKLFDNIGEEDGSLNTVITPKPRMSIEVTKNASSVPAPDKLSGNAETSKPVAVARTAVPQNVQKVSGPNKKPVKGEKPTIVPRKSGISASKLDVEKSTDGKESPVILGKSADLCISQAENNDDVEHNSSTKEFERGEGDLFKKDIVTPEVRPSVKPEPPKTLNIRQTTDISASLDDDLFNDGPVTDIKDSGIVHSNTLGALSTQRKPVQEDVTDGSMIRGPTRLHSNKEALAAIMAEKDDNSSESLRPSPKPKLNIDPLALLPGAKPPTRTERLEKAASFDKPASDLVATLPSAGKDRVKIQVKRRPQTRRARQEAIRASLIENEDGSLGDIPALSDVSSEKLPDTQNADVEAPQPKTSLLITEPDTSPSADDLPQTLQPGASEKTSNPRLLLPNSNPLSPSTDEEDFFGVPPDLPFDYGNSKDADCNGNLFGDAPVLSPLDLHSVKTFSERNDDALSADVFFASSRNNNQNTFGGDSSKIISAPSKSLFNATENSNLDIPNSQTPALDSHLGDSGNKNADNFDDVPDLFGQKGGRSTKNLQDLFPTVKKESVAKTEDNSLFRGTNVIKNQPPNLFSGSDEDDDDGDLFSFDKSRTRNSDKAKDVKPVPNLFTNSSKSSNDFGSPKTNFSKGADSVLNSKSIIKVSEDIFTSILPREEKLFSEDRNGGQLIPDKCTKIVSGVSGDQDEDNLFSSSNIFQSSVAVKSSLGAEKSTKKGASLFGDDSPESEDLFSNASASSNKKVALAKTTASSEIRSTQQIKPSNKMQRSIFDDDDDEDIFSKPSSKSSSSSNISQSILGASADPYDLFANVPASKTIGSKAQKEHGGSSRIKVNEKDDIFEDPLMALKK